jgi:hypothetical protein
MVSAILTLFHEMTDMYISDDGVSVIWSPATNQAVVQKFLPIFI